MGNVRILLQLSGESKTKFSRGCALRFVLFIKVSTSSVNMAEWEEPKGSTLHAAGAYRAFDEAPEIPELSVPVAPPPDVSFPTESSSREDPPPVGIAFAELLTSPPDMLADVVRRLSSRQDSAENLLKLRDAIDGALRGRSGTVYSVTQPTGIPFLWFR